VSFLLILVNKIKPVLLPEVRLLFLREPLKTPYNLYLDDLQRAFEIGRTLDSEVVPCEVPG